MSQVGDKVFYDNFEEFINSLGLKNEIKQSLGVQDQIELFFNNTPFDPKNCTIELVNGIGVIKNESSMLTIRKSLSDTLELHDVEFKPDNAIYIPTEGTKVGCTDAFVEHLSIKAEENCIDATFEMQSGWLNLNSDSFDSYNLFKFRSSCSKSNYTWNLDDILIREEIKSYDEVLPCREFDINERLNFCRGGHDEHYNRFLSRDEYIERENIDVATYCRADRVDGKMKLTKRGMVTLRDPQYSISNSTYCPMLYSNITLADEIMPLSKEDIEQWIMDDGNPNKQALRNLAKGRDKFYYSAADDKDYVNISQSENINMSM